MWELLRTYSLCMLQANCERRIESRATGSNGTAANVAPFGASAGRVGVSATRRTGSQFVSKAS